MGKNYFNIHYEFDKAKVHSDIRAQIESGHPDYICVADGVILEVANRDPEYQKVINSGMFSICDSSYVPLYIRWLYGKRYEQYSGSDIFRDVISSKMYRMAFLGSQEEVLRSLQKELSEMNPDVSDMLFYELPFLQVEEFNYEGIAEMLRNDGADIIWIALGAPKQERFMYRLKPYLSHGVMIAVGAAFKFYSGTDVNRAPDWMVKHHLEFLFRIYSEPKKQLKRCYNITRHLPGMLVNENRRKRLSRLTDR